MEKCANSNCPLKASCNQNVTIMMDKEDDDKFPVVTVDIQGWRLLCANYKSPPPLPALKPCAHCGEDTVTIIQNGDAEEEDGIWMYWCLKCFNKGEFYHSRLEAITAANRRPPLPKTQTSVQLTRENIMRADMYYVGRLLTDHDLIVHAALNALLKMI